MQAWEHEIVGVTVDAAPGVLKERGLAGWELCGVMTTLVQPPPVYEMREGKMFQGTPPPQQGLGLAFKRPLPQEAVVPAAEQPARVLLGV